MAALHFAGRHFPGSQTITANRQSYVLKSLNLIGPQGHNQIDLFIAENNSCFSNLGLMKYHEGTIVRVSRCWIDEDIVV